MMGWVWRGCVSGFRCPSHSSCSCCCSRRRPRIGELSSVRALCLCVSRTSSKPHVPAEPLSPLPPSFLSHNPSGALTRGVVDVWSCGPGEARGAGEGRHLISVCPGACLEPHLISAPPFLRTDIRLEHPHQPRPKERERDLSRVSFGACAGVRFQGLNHN